jgi:3-hydroxybutyryl-CoA dehydrogenase
MKARDVSRIAVIGAGTMGAGVAAEFARVGCQVWLVDVDPALLKRGLQRIKMAQKALIGAKLLTRRDAAAALKRVATTTDMAAACREAQLVIEAASENMTLKKKLFSALDRLCPAGAVLASNTSGLSITEIASATKRPGKVAGMHFWNPPHLCPLVEVIRGKQTSPATAKLLVELAQRIGKRPILVKHDVPGFVGNRLQFAVLREALHLLSAGVASAEDIDTAMTAGPGFRYNILGPLRTADLGGLDVFHAISSYLFADLSADRKPPALLSQLVRDRNLGAKTGKGFYRYSEREFGESIIQRDRVLLGLLNVLKKEKGAPR